MKFLEVAKQAAEKDVLFFHIDCGAFLPHRFNPDKMRTEFWNGSAWAIVQEDPPTCNDWILSSCRRTDHETIKYETDSNKGV